MMIVKVHKSDQGILLAVCDSDILGKKFETDKLQLDLTGSFYAGEEKSDEDFREMIKTAYMINAIGKNSVDFLMKEGLVEEGRIITIQDVPHVQIVLIRN